MSLNKKLFIIICSALFLLLSANSVFSKTVSWKLGYGGAPNDPNHQLLMGFVQALEKNSEGQFKMKIVLSAPLGYGMQDALRYLKQGLGQASVVAPNYMGRDEPLLGNLLPQGLLLEKDDNEKLFEPITKTINSIYNKWGAELRGPVINAIMVDWVLISKEPISSLDQLRGKKIRHSDKIGLKALNDLGVAAQFVPANETYMALKTGVIDGAAYSRVFTLKTSMFEVTDYMSSMYPYSVAAMPGVAVSKKAWAKLPKDLQEAFDKTAKEYLWDGMYTKWKSDVYEKSAEAELLKKGMKVLKPFSREDRIKIQKATLKTWRKECEQLGPEAVANYDLVTSLIEIGE